VHETDSAILIQEWHVALPFVTAILLDTLVKYCQLLCDIFIPSQSAGAITFRKKRGLFAVVMVLLESRGGLVVSVSSYEATGLGSILGVAIFPR